MNRNIFLRVLKNGLLIYIASVVSMFVVFLVLFTIHEFIVTGKVFEGMKSYLKLITAISDIITLLGFASFPFLVFIIAHSLLIFFKKIRIITEPISSLTVTVIVLAFPLIFSFVDILNEGFETRYIRKHFNNSFNDHPYEFETQNKSNRIDMSNFKTIEWQNASTYVEGCFSNSNFLMKRKLRFINDNTVILTGDVFKMENWWLLKSLYKPIKFQEIPNDTLNVVGEPVYTIERDFFTNKEVNIITLKLENDNPKSTNYTIRIEYGRLMLLPEFSDAPPLNYVIQN